MGAKRPHPSGFLEARYYQTYYYANIIDNILEDPFPYIRNLDDFYGDLSRYTFFEPFPKFSHFHRFISFIIEDLISEEMRKFDISEAQKKSRRYKRTIDPFDYSISPVERSLSYHGLEHESFREWITGAGTPFEEATDDHLYDWFCELRLCEEYEKLMTALVDETFFVMFMNRKAMTKFNVLMSGVISEIALEETPKEFLPHMQMDGKLHRAKIPVWAKRAVFFRERGRCAITKRDLSGLLSNLEVAHFDHIVPLNQGGLNDISNLQLLAGDVNLAKSGSSIKTSLTYERWY